MNKYVLGGILLLSLVARLYHFNNPMADLHSWRQSDTASVARNLVRSNFDVLHPQIESAVSIDGIGRDNTTRYHFAEFPIYQAAVAAVSYPVAQIHHGTLTQNVVLAGRIVSTFSSLIAIIGLYLLCTRYYSDKVALLAAFVYGLLPYNIFWSRAVLPDSMMVMFCLFMLYWFDVWIRGEDEHHHRLLTLKSWSFWLALICFALALLLKAFVPFLLLPVAYIVWKRFGLAAVKQPALWIFAILAVMPFVGWRIWMQNWPFSIPASGWLFDGNKVRLRPAWWHWIVQVRLDQFMFNATGLFLIGLGLFFYKEITEVHFHIISKKRKDAEKYVWYLPLCLLSCFIYLIVFATGNTQHEYYQLPITPFGSILVAVGFWYLWRKMGSYLEMVMRRLLALAFIAITLMLGWYSVRDWYIIGNPALVTVGERADQILPKNAQVIADYGGDTTFLYYVNRKGWSVRDKQLQEIIDRGATVYVSMHRDDYINKLARLYKVIDETPEYVMIDLLHRRGDWTGIKDYEL